MNLTSLPNRRIAGAAMRTASPKGVAEIQQTIDLLQMTAKFGGTSPKTQARIAKQKQLMEMARRPERKFSPEVSAQVEAFLTKKGPLPSGLEAPQQELLQEFAPLAEKGVRFTDAKGQDLNHTEAFLQLAKHDFHARDEQVMLKTFSRGMMSSSTVRPHYLPAINFFLDKTLEGESFYRPEGTKAKDDIMAAMLGTAPDENGYIPIRTASTFVDDYSEDPSQALVRWGDSYGTLAARPESESPAAKEAARLRAEVEKLAGIGEQEPEIEGIEFGDDFISVGGVMLDRA